VESHPELLQGQMRCMVALGQWGEVIDLSNQVSAFCGSLRACV